MGIDTTNKKEVMSEVLELVYITTKEIAGRDNSNALKGAVIPKRVLLTESQILLLGYTAKDLQEKGYLEPQDVDPKYCRWIPELLASRQAKPIERVTHNSEIIQQPKISVLLERAAKLTKESRQEDISLLFIDAFELDIVDTKKLFDKIQEQTKLGKRDLEKIFAGIKNILADRPISKAVKNSEPIDPRFEQLDLIDEIWKELDKSHKMDHKEKIALFLIGVTAELPDPSDRKSAAIKGDSSAGKDNAIRTIFGHLPNEGNKFLTHTTPAALRKGGLDGVRRIAFSEMNAHRENGANKDIVETFKQLAEGGINAEICDPNTKEPITIKAEQTTLFYGTTETDSDDELETRYVVIPIQSSEAKNQLVVESNLSNSSNEEFVIRKALNAAQEKESWIAQGIRNLDHDIHVVIPFNDRFREPIKDMDGKEKKLFDYSKPRIMRDAKRLECLTKAIAFLYQKQRVVVQKNGVKLLYAEPFDFLLAIYIFADFFNLTYTGLDHRMQAVYDKILELQGDHDSAIMTLGYGNNFAGWVLRHKVQEALHIQSAKTMKDRTDKLKDYQLIETHYDHGIPRGYLVRGYKQGSNRAVLPISYGALSGCLGAYCTPEIKQNIYQNKDVSVNLEKIESFFGNLSPSKLRPSNLTKEHITKYLAEADPTRKGVHFDTLKDEFKAFEHFAEVWDKMRSAGDVVEIKSQRWCVL